MNTHRPGRLSAIARYGALAVFAIAATVGYAQDPVIEALRVTDENVPFIYEAHAVLPTPEHKLAAIISTDYARAKDEFTKHDLLQEIRPLLKKRIEDARAIESVVLRVGTNIGNYDFDSGSFPTGMGESSYIPFRNGYAVAFSNGTEMTSLPVAIDKARSLSSALRGSRKAVIEIHGTVLGSEETSLSYSRSKVVNVRITKIEMSLRSGADVGSKTI